jgi:hypothetical protein
MTFIEHEERFIGEIPNVVDGAKRDGAKAMWDPDSKFSVWLQYPMQFF